MKTLREVLEDAERRRVAVDHFNFFNLAALEAIFGAALDTLPTASLAIRTARRVRAPVIP